MQSNSNQPTPAPPQADNAALPPGEPLAAGLLPIPPLIQSAQAAFRRDLPELMKTHYRQWVVYQGDQRLGFGRSQTQLIQECLRRGLRQDEFVVRSVEPEAPDEVECVVD